MDSLNQDPIRTFGHLQVWVKSDPPQDASHRLATMDWGTYEGRWVGGKAEGWGVQTITILAEPTVYRGYWKKGKRNGYGKLEVPTQFYIFEGGWKDGERHGYGRSFTYKKDEIRVWEGTVKQDKLHGWGTIGYAPVSNTQESGKRLYVVSNSSLSSMESVSPTDSSIVLAGFREDYICGYERLVVDNQEMTIGIGEGNFAQGFHLTKRYRSTDPWKLEKFLEHGKCIPSPNKSDIREPQWLPREVHLSPMGATFHSCETAIADGHVTWMDGKSYTGDLQYGVPNH